MLRVVSPGELETCTCACVERTVCIEPEEYPRCFECPRPVRQYHSLNVESRWVYLVWALREPALGRPGSSSLSLQELWRMNSLDPEPVVHLPLEDRDLLDRVWQVADDQVRCAELHMQRIAEIVWRWESAGEVYRQHISEGALDDISELVQSYRRQFEMIGNGLASDII